jgi:class 3 adenylate cyclase
MLVVFRKKRAPARLDGPRGIRAGIRARFDSQLLISEIVWEAVPENRVQAVPMGQVQVKGREEAIQVFQVA